MKKYIIWIDSLITTFSIVESGKDISYNYQDKDNANLFDNINRGDIILGYYAEPIEKASIMFIVKDKTSGNTLVLSKMFETAEGTTIEDKVFVSNLEEKGIVELSDTQYDMFVADMMTSIRETVDIEKTNCVLESCTQISESDFRKWLSNRTKKDGSILSKEYQNAYYYILKAIPSMLGFEDVFAIKSYAKFETYRKNIVKTEIYEEANPNIGSGTLSAALTQYGNYLAERNGISLSAERLAEILKDWYTQKYVENNITSTLVGYGFKYAQAINMAKVSSKSLLDLAKIESTMAAYIDRGKDLYAAMEKSSIGFKILSKNGETNGTVVDFDYYSLKGDSTNKIFYGVPGCGKSYHIQHKILGTTPYIRTTFYQDYSNTDFVGQILPKVVKGENGEKDTVEYIFNPGPFTLALIQAISNPEDKVALVIEEINRGNAPAIFGDIFQLLDRDDDSISEYGIKNVGMIDYLNSYEFTVGGEKKRYHFDEIKIPGNLDIYATMNTSDQNVYTLDTAFTRRWAKEHIPNEFNGHKIQGMYIPGMSNYTWGEFVEAVNEQIRNNLESLQVNEDKQVGAFFVKEKDLLEKPADSTEQKAKMFAYKVLEYLWADVSKLDHSIIFNPRYTTFEALVKDFAKGVVVFNDKLGFKATISTTVETE